MAAAQFDIELEEFSNLRFEFVYRDAAENPIDVTGYGATIVLKSSNSNEPLYVGYSTDSDAPVVMGTTDGLIEVDVPHEHFKNLDIKTGLWQLYIYPDVNNKTENTIRLIEGEFVYSKALL